MTTRPAGPPVRVRGKVHGHVPAAVRYRFFHVLWQARTLAFRAYLMTGPARSAFRDSIHVDEVKVLVTVAEVSQFGGCLVGPEHLEGLFVVAGEAEAVLSVRIGYVE